jgi:NADPH:quinone reductase-like Zn-dependent oxidoreductase
MENEAGPMHAVRIDDRHRRSARYEEIQTPQAGIGDVLVQVMASSFTPTELEWPSTWVDRAGRDRSPVVPGHEVSGIVAGLGYGTTGLEVGDAVYGLTDWYRDGAAAEFVAVEARNLAPKPAALSHVEAAALSLAGLTAWQGLFVHGRLMSGQTVVVLGAAGGVGSLAVQLAHNAGASVIAVAHSRAFPFLESLGAEAVVDASEAKASDAAGADLLFDLVGADLVNDSMAMLRPGGVMVSIVTPDLPVGVDSRFFVVEPDRGQLSHMAQLVETERVRPIVSRVVGLRDAATQEFGPRREAGVPGKVVLQPSKQD